MSNLLTDCLILLETNKIDLNENLKTFYLFGLLPQKWIAKNSKIKKLLLIKIKIFNFSFSNYEKREATISKIILFLQST
jgi:hypothetical protein